LGEGQIESEKNLLYKGVHDVADLDGDHFPTPKGEKPETPLLIQMKLNVISVEPRIVSPQRGFEGRLRDPTDPFQLIAQYLFLKAQLGLIGHMLPLAAPTGSEIGAARLHPIRGRTHYLQESGSSVPALILDDLDEYLFPRQGVGNKDHLSFMAAQGLAAMGHACQLHADGHTISS